VSENFERAIGPDRRTFVKRLVIGSAFAAPIISSFKMSGVQAVFGGQQGAITGVANSNTTQPSGPPNYPDQVYCAIVSNPNGQTFQASDGAVSLKLQVPKSALEVTTEVCIFRGDLDALGPEVPAGHTPKSAYGVAWNSPPFIPPNAPDAASALTLTVDDPTVNAGDPVYVFDKSTGDPEIAGTATAGSWVVNFVQDPGFVVTTPTPPATPGAPGATPEPPAAVVAEPQTTG